MSLAANLWHSKLLLYWFSNETFFGFKSHPAQKSKSFSWIVFNQAKKEGADFFRERETYLKDAWSVRQVHLLEP